jgi:hypothetical protein
VIKFRFRAIIVSSLVVFSVALLFGCGGGGSGGSSEELPLSAAITSPSGSIDIYLDDSVKFLATVSGGSKPYTYEWVSNGGTYLPIYYVDYSDPWSCYWDRNVDDDSFISTREDPEYLGFIMSGSYTVSLTVTDRKGAKAVDEVTVNVQNEYNPEAPTVEITYPPEGQTFKVGDSIEFEYTISGGTSPYVHAGGVGCSSSFVINNGSLDMTPTDCVLPMMDDDTVVFTDPGNYYFRLEALDSAGHLGNGTVSFIVEE